MTNLQLFFAILSSVTVVLGLQTTLFKFYMDAKFDGFRSYIDAKFDGFEKVWRAELQRVEEVLDARLKHLEER